jgi:hypothetical protein
VSSGGLRQLQGGDGEVRERLQLKGGNVDSWLTGAMVVTVLQRKIDGGRRAPAPRVGERAWRGDLGGRVLWGGGRRTREKEERGRSALGRWASHEGKRGDVLILGFIVGPHEHVTTLTNSGISSSYNEYTSKH